MALATYSNEAYGESMAQSRRAPVNEAMEALDREIDQLDKNSEMLEMRWCRCFCPGSRSARGADVMTLDRPLPMNEPPELWLSDELRMRRERIRGLTLHLTVLQSLSGYVRITLRRTPLISLLIAQRAYHPRVAPGR